MVINGLIGRESKEKKKEKHLTCLYLFSLSIQILAEIIGSSTERWIPNPNPNPDSDSDSDLDSDLAFRLLTSFLSLCLIL